MAVARGVPLQAVWKGSQPRQRAAVVRAIAEAHLDMSSTTFKGYGSIYFGRDLDDDHRIPLQHTQGISVSNDNLVLGPITGRTWNYEGRQYIELDRAPWTTLHQYLTAVGRREMICVQQVPKLSPTQVTRILCSNRRAKDPSYTLLPPDLAASDAFRSGSTESIGLAQRPSP
ncbi:hypothetical protein AC579_4612 [Pseudocercospora musae]|uniref:Uncharacterized protein n=1 Tax=Pseudocercospora musae TaxID=113226 RepID=A0A139H244_9PEZI|nr:hypothetical protein AC579_4612 [Pseudocercospora musae]KXS96540.1 hypothetical protein AC579_4612 [Pseudocercospora musae]